MYKYFLTYLFLLAAVANSMAQGNTTALENSLLWEISGNGLTQNSYLYGTIHLIDEKNFFITTETQQALDKAERYVFEIDTKSMLIVMHHQN
jgi:uncharacterized protein YbaP (TraB family)